MEEPWLSYGDPWFGRTYLKQPRGCFDTLPEPPLCATFYDELGNPEHVYLDELDS